MGILMKLILSNRQRGCALHPRVSRQVQWASWNELNGFYKSWGITWLAEQLLASQQRLCSMQLLKPLIKRPIKLTETETNMAPQAALQVYINKFCWNLSRSHNLRTDRRTEDRCDATDVSVMANTFCIHTIPKRQTEAAGSHFFNVDNQQGCFSGLALLPGGVNDSFRFRFQQRTRTLKRFPAYTKQTLVTLFILIIVPLLWRSSSYITDLLDRLARQVHLQLCVSERVYE